MKLSITFKDPDVVHDAAFDAAIAQLPTDLSKDEKEIIADRRCAAIKDQLNRWISYDEYVTIVFDIEAGTAIVKERK